MLLFRRLAVNASRLFHPDTTMVDPVKFTPRYYQKDAVEAIWRSLRAFDDNLCAELPTGAGKSWVLAMLAHDATTRWNGRVLILAHRKELIEQNFEKIRTLLPDDVSLGINSAGLKSRDTDAQVIVAGIQSVYDKACDLGPFDLVIPDEAHLIPPSGDGMYRTLLNDLKLIRPHMRVVGLTATPYRMKGGKVCRPENILNRMCYRVGVSELIEKGFLCPLYSNEAQEKIDTSGLHVRRGEFIQSEADALWSDPEIVERAVREILERTRDREKVLIFAQGIEHSELVRTLIADAGHDCEGVYGHTGNLERDLILQEFKDGQIKYLTNCEVLTTGFDAPDIDCVVLLRPTASAGLLYQMCGRGFRIHPGKKNCLILDFAGNIDRHGPIDELSQKMEGSGNGSGTGEAPVKTCPECGNMVGISVMECPNCHHEWEAEPTVGHTDRPSETPILSGQGGKKHRTEYTLERVENVEFIIHKKKGADDDHPRVLRVRYDLSTGECSEWVCLEHTGYARTKGRTWWNERTGSTDYPETISEAHQVVESLHATGSVKIPEYVLMRHKEHEKYPELVKCIMESDLDPEWTDRPGWKALCDCCGNPVFPQLKRKQCQYCSNWFIEPILEAAEADDWDAKLSEVPF